MGQVIKSTTTTTEDFMGPNSNNRRSRASSTFQQPQVTTTSTSAGDIFTNNNKNNKPITILLLGPGENGKSTLFKQIQLMYNKGIASEETRKEMKSDVYENLLENIRNLILGTQTLEIKICNEKAIEYATTLVNESLTINDLLENPKDWKEKIEMVWKDEGIQQAFQNREEFQLYDSAEYLFKNIQRICENDYIPSIDDILHTRVKTLGIIEMAFELNSGQQLKLVDVGGQRNERKKWIHLFSDVDAIVFMVSLSEFDLTCYESNETWRVQETVEVLRDISNKPMFLNTPLIMILNKKDILQQKLKNKSFKQYFKEFKGDEKDDKEVIEFLKQYYLQFTTDHARDNLRVYPLSAIDQNETKNVFTEVADFVIKESEKRKVLQQQEIANEKARRRKSTKL
ncbi:hypothetical protein ABK040_008126 [Willaertia magna]